MNHNRNIQFLSSGGLFIAALLWGVSYPATKLVEDYPTFFILPARFLIASAILAVLFRKHFRKMNREILKHAALLSLFVTSMYVFSTVGIKYTISARASFFTCLTFVIVPVLNRLLFRVKISGVILRSIILCFAGVLLLSYAPGMAGLALNYGDLLCIVASVAGSLHIVFLGRVSKKETFDPMLFTTLLMAFVTVWTALAALFTGSFQGIEITGFDLRHHRLSGRLLQRSRFSASVRLPEIRARQQSRCHLRHGAGLRLRPVGSASPRIHGNYRLDRRSAGADKLGLYGDGKRQEGMTEKLL